MSDLHLWIQTPLPVNVEKVDKLDTTTCAVDCTDGEFSRIEAALYQVLHRTTEDDPLRIVQQTQGQTGFRAWRAIVRRYDPRNMADTNLSNVQL